MAVIQINDPSMSKSPDVEMQDPSSLTGHIEDTKQPTAHEVAGAGHTATDR